MKQLIYRTLIICTLVLGSQHALAQCDCAGASKDIRGTRYSTAYEELENADAVFYGQVVAKKMIAREPDRKGANDYEVEITFRVEKAWRRDLDEFITVREYTDGCIIGFDIAERWLVYAQFDEDKKFRTGYCTRTRIAYKNVENDFKEFEKNNVKPMKINKVLPK